MVLGEQFLRAKYAHSVGGVHGCSLTRSLGGQVGFGGDGDGMNDGLEGEVSR